MDKRVKTFLSLLAILCLSIPLVVAEKKIIYLDHADILTFNKDRLADCQVLIGNVQFRHENAVMYCDSAYFYNKSNSLTAFSNVQMIQADSIHLYGDVLYYDGDTRLARVRDNIRLENGQATLFTDSLNYDRRADVAYYFDGGKIIDKTNELTSTRGKFSPSKNVAIFQYDVILTNPDMRLTSDTLIYNTSTHIANIVGPSNIYFDNAEIYSTRGWYNTDTEVSELYDRSTIVDYDGHDMVADIIRYDRKTSNAHGFNNIIINDSVDNIQLTGNYGYYNDKQDTAFTTKRATLIYYDIEESDTIYATADTIFYSKHDSITNIRGNYNVQCWSKDCQGIADSVYYTSADSIGRMFGTPVAWQDNNQSTGDSIYIYTKDGEVNKIETMGSAFMLMKNDTLYNQMSGKRVTCYIDSGKLHKIFVDGNALSVYFAEEDKDPDATPSDTVNYVGVNRSESSEITIYVDTATNKPKRIVLTPASSGTLYTPKQIGNREITQLKGLLDCFNLRPTDKDDIYNPKDKKKLKAAAETKPKHKRKKR